MKPPDELRRAPGKFKRRDFLLSTGAIMLVPRLVGASMSGANAYPPIKVGQVGTRHAHAAGKMQALRTAPQDWAVVGYSEKSETAAAAASESEAFRGLPFLSEEQLLATPGLNVVVVETHLDESCEAALRAIRAGKHVHLDKPGAHAHDAFRTMRREAEQRGVIVQMGYMLRYNPAFELLFRCVRDGWLGEILEIDASMGKLSGPAERAAVKALPGGSMFELGCHLIDAIVTLLGPPQAVRGFSSPARDDGVKDNQLAVLAYPRATATVRTNLSDPFGGPRRRFSVTGTGGSFEILPLESGQVKLALVAAHESYAKGIQSIQVGSKEGRYDGEFRDLARVVRGEKAFAWNAEHDIAVHKTVLQASGMA